MSASGDFGDAPSGVNLNDDQSGQIIGAVTTVMVLSTVFLVIRLFTRVFQKAGGITADDYLIVIGWIFTTGTAICCLLSTHYGCGKHLWAVTAVEIETVSKILYSYVYLYATGVSVTKLSILMFYRRVFGVTPAFWVCLGLVVCYWVAIIIAWVNVCVPIDYFFYRDTRVDKVGHCFSDSKFYFGNGIANMLIDVCVLAYPVPIVWRLNMPLTKKLSVVGILMLGSFVCVASIVRLVHLNELISSSDITFTMGPVFIWSCVEPYVGILCACLPTFAPLVRVIWNKARGKDTDYQTPTGGNSNTTGLQSGTGLANKPQKSGYRASKKNSAWSKIGDSGSPGDDELELTNDINITGGGHLGASVRTTDSDEDFSFPSSGIMVKNDVKWTSSEAEIDKN